MTETFDIAIVGAGITGCAIARQLARFDLSICVVEAANDIALGASKANGGLVHAGYDPAPGTVKAQINARGCELYGTWAQELGFFFAVPGRWCWGLTTKTAHNWSSCGATALPTVCPSCRSSDPTASTNWSRAPVPMQRVRCGAPRLDLSTRLRLPSPRWKTPSPTG